MELLVALAIFAAAYWFLFVRGKVSSDRAHQMVRDGAVLLDVRTTGEFAGGHIDGARNIPLSDLPSRVGELKKEGKPIVVYCQSGMRSGSAVRLLAGEGLSVVDLGAMSRW